MRTRKSENVSIETICKSACKGAKGLAVLVSGAIQAGERRALAATRGR